MSRASCRVELPTCLECYSVKGIKTPPTSSSKTHGLEFHGYRVRFPIRTDTPYKLLLMIYLATVFTKQASLSCSIHCQDVSRIIY